MLQTPYLMWKNPASPQLGPQLFFTIHAPWPLHALSSQPTMRTAWFGGSPVVEL